MNRATPPVFHRYDGDYLSTTEWGALLKADTRVARALGPEPISDARHLLPRPPDSILAPRETGTDILPGADFLIDCSPDTPRTVAEIYPYFAPDVRATLDFPRVFVQIPGRDGNSVRTMLLDDAADVARVRSIVLAWSLPDLVSIGNVREATADLRRFLADATYIGTQARMSVTVREAPDTAAQRATSLRVVVQKIGGNVEMRLLPIAGSFASRDIWRALYSTGLVWGSMDLFHWQVGPKGESLFRVFSSGTPAYFLPERAAEGERVPGLVLEYDLPRSTAPLVVFDAMALALAYLRGQLGGRPVTKAGAELDADRLEEERDNLQAAVVAMTKAGIAPGSAAALRFF